MVTLFIWFGYIGAWLLVAGPIWQAAVELRDEGFDEDEQGMDFRNGAETVSAPERDSGWWWLIPPVAYLKAMRRRRAWRDAVFAAMPKATMAKLIGFQNKATGWLIVAAGALLIGLKETAELVEHLEWPFWLVVPAALVPAFLSVWHTAGRMARLRRLEEESGLVTSSPQRGARHGRGSASAG